MHIDSCTVIIVPDLRPQGRAWVECGSVHLQEARVWAPACVRGWVRVHVGCVCVYMCMQVVVHTYASICAPIHDCIIRVYV